MVSAQGESGRSGQTARSPVMVRFDRLRSNQKGVLGQLGQVDAQQHDLIAVPEVDDGAAPDLARQVQHLFRIGEVEVGQIQKVVVDLEVEDPVAATTLLIDEGVVVRPADQGIEPGTAVKRVASRSAEERVDAAATVEVVVAIMVAGVFVIVDIIALLYNKRYLESTAQPAPRANDMENPLNGDSFFLSKFGHRCLGS